MKTIGISAEQAEEALVHLAGHVHSAVPIGRPILVLQREDREIQVSTPTGEWFVYSDQVDRLVTSHGGHAELTTWRDGNEISRLARRLE